jgi:hypothetical protein
MWDESAGEGGITGEDIENQIMLSNFSRLLDRLPTPLEKKKFRRLCREAMYVPMGHEKAAAKDKAGNVLERVDSERFSFKFISEFGKLVVKKFGRKLSLSQLAGVGTAALLSGWRRLNTLDERETEALSKGILEAFKDLGLDRDNS